MLNMMESARADIKNAVMEALGRCVADGALPPEPIPAFTIEVPGDRTHGDFATNAALISAKAFKMPPRNRAEIAGPGFINFFLGVSWYASAVSAVLKGGKSYGRSDKGAGKKVMVEYVSANPTGPMHMGNARGGALGDCLASCSTGPASR
jgi:arginyl-tRNA synthetase